MEMEVFHNPTHHDEISLQADRREQEYASLPSICRSDLLINFVNDLPIDREISSDLVERIQGTLQEYTSLQGYVVTKVGEQLSKDLPLQHKPFWNSVSDLNFGKPLVIKSPQGWKVSGCSKVMTSSPFFSAELSVGETQVYIKLGYAFNGDLGCHIDPELIEAAPIASLIDKLCKEHLSADRLRGYTFIVKYFDNPLREVPINYEQAASSLPSDINSAISWCFGQIISALSK